MEFPIKGGQWEVPSEWVIELEKVYYNVQVEMGKMRLWLIAKPEGRPTKSGAKRFMVNWMNKHPHLVRPATKKYEQPIYEKATETVEVRKARLAELKAAIK